jgi:hypothetical protein
MRPVLCEPELLIQRVTKGDAGGDRLDLMNDQRNEKSAEPCHNRGQDNY